MPKEPEVQGSVFDCVEVCRERDKTGKLVATIKFSAKESRGQAFVNTVSKNAAADLIVELTRYLAAVD